MDAWNTDFVDLLEPAFILFGPEGNEFAFGCVTGAFGGADEHDAIQFAWTEPTRWTRPSATVGPNASPTAPSPEKYNSTTATNPTSSTPLGDFFNTLLGLCQGNRIYLDFTDSRILR